MCGAADRGLNRSASRKAGSASCQRFSCASSDPSVSSNSAAWAAPGSGSLVPEVWFGETAGQVAMAARICASASAGFPAAASFRPAAPWASARLVCAALSPGFSFSAFSSSGIASSGRFSCTKIAPRAMRASGSCGASLTVSAKSRRASSSLPACMAAYPARKAASAFCRSALAVPDGTVDPVAA